MRASYACSASYLTKVYCVIKRQTRHIFQGTTNTSPISQEGFRTENAGPFTSSWFKNESTSREHAFTPENPVHQFSHQPPLKWIAGSTKAVPNIKPTDQGPCVDFRPIPSIPGPLRIPPLSFVLTNDQLHLSTCLTPVTLVIALDNLVKQHINWQNKFPRS